MCGREGKTKLFSSPQPLSTSGEGEKFATVFFGRIMKIGVMFLSPSPQAERGGFACPALCGRVRKTTEKIYFHKNNFPCLLPYKQPGN
jgi:hypothetical protein